jgi:apolipoprotein N-acyltransferase
LPGAPNVVPSLIASLASASLFAVAQNVPGWSWVSLLCLVPLCAVVDSQRFFLCWAAFGTFGLVGGLSTVWWISNTGPGYAWVVLLVGVHTALWYVLIPVCCRFFPVRNSAAALLAVPVAIWLAEVGERLLLFQVPPVTLGQPLVEWGPVAQLGAIGGPESLSFLAAAVSVSIGLSFRVCGWGCRLGGLIQVLVVVLLAFGAGLLPVLDPASATVLRVGLVQPGIRQREKWDDGKRQSTLHRMNKLIDSAAASGADIVILPETAVAGLVRYDPELTAFVKNAVSRTLKPLLFGSLDRSADSAELYNVAVLVTPYDTVTFYRKQRLVPITERALSLPGWGRLLNRGGPQDFTAGKERTTFELTLQDVRFGALICFEDMFPELTRQSALAGAQFLVALVNTEPFDGTPGPLQHLRRARLAAIAAGLPVVRATNSGISGVIDEHGRMADAMPVASQNAGEFRVVELRTGSVSTPYRALGDSCAPAAAGILFVLAYGANLVLRPPRLRAELASSPPGKQTKSF